MSADSRDTPAARGLALFANFFFIILAYYLIKPASRSIFLDHYTAVQLPYVWIGSALVLGLMMPVYGYLVDRLDRRRLVVATCVLFSLLVFGFGLLFRAGYTSPGLAAAFYILADILSVMLVEQFWSLTNSSYSSRHGSRWYGIVGSGGLVGGLVGGALATWLLRNTPMVTYDLLLLSALIIACMGGYAYALARKEIYSEIKLPILPPGMDASLSFRELLKNRYLVLIVIMVLIAQLVEPIVEYQFMSKVEEAYRERELRTQFLSFFLSILGGVALAINLLITPLVLRRFGALAGMLFQPVALMIASVFFYANTTLLSGAVMKISDRGLSYSLNRAAKEMLYIPLDPVLIYRAKAGIDMFGYRLFKIAGAVLVLAMTQWFGLQWQPVDFCMIVIPVCLIWVWVVILLREDYRELLVQEAVTAPAV
ncbi:MAG: Npt1/Npt2 family nucleotide transporter [Gammaproteobacteria bacterium]